MNDEDFHVIGTVEETPVVRSGAMIRTRVHRSTIMAGFGLVEASAFYCGRDITRGDVVMLADLATRTGRRRVRERLLKRAARARRRHDARMDRA